jgi:hypothetical protein
MWFGGSVGLASVWRGIGRARTLFERQHGILVIDFEDEGIIEHLTLEGKYADLAMEHLQDIRKARS